MISPSPPSHGALHHLSRSLSVRNKSLMQVVSKFSLGKRQTAASSTDTVYRPGSCCIGPIGTRPTAPKLCRRRIGAGRTLTGFEARGCRRQLRGCDRPKNLGHSLRLTGPIGGWVIPPEEVKQRPAGHFKGPESGPASAYPTPKVPRASTAHDLTAHAHIRAG